MNHCDKIKNKKGTQKKRTEKINGQKEETMDAPDIMDR